MSLAYLGWVVAGEKGKNLIATGTSIFANDISQDIEGHIEGWSTIPSRFCLFS